MANSSYTPAPLVGVSNIIKSTTPMHYMSPNDNPEAFPPQKTLPCYTYLSHSQSYSLRFDLIPWFKRKCICIGGPESIHGTQGGPLMDDTLQ